MSQPEQKNAFSNLGIVLSGLVSHVDSYTNKKTGEEKWSVHLFVPGSIVVKVGLKREPAEDRFQQAQPVKMKVAVGDYQGNIYFNELV